MDHITANNFAGVNDSVAGVCPNLHDLLAGMRGIILDVVGELAECRGMGGRGHCKERGGRKNIAGFHGTSTVMARLTDHASR